MNINFATAQYTGGGIYIYYGQLENGDYFRTGDGEDFIEICDAYAGTDDADYSEFYEEHRIKTLTDYSYIVLWNNILNWIIKNNPKGNYLSSELEDRIIDINPNIVEAVEYLESWDAEATKENLIKVFKTWIANLQSQIGPEAHKRLMVNGVTLGTNITWDEVDKVHLRKIEEYQQCLKELEEE